MANGGRAGLWESRAQAFSVIRLDAHVATPTVGIDLGVSRLATVSDGTTCPASRPLRRYLGKVKRLSRALSRKKLGSRNRAKAKTKLARLHRRIGDIRADLLHKLTTSLTRHQTVVIEDLNVRGMLAKRSLSRAIADAGFFEFRRQLEYKTPDSPSSSWSLANAKARLTELVDAALACTPQIITRHGEDVVIVIATKKYAETIVPGSAYATQKPTNNGYLLDTNAVSELTKPRPNNGLLQFLATVPEYRLFLSVLTIGELVSGLHRLPESKKKLGLWTWLTTDLVARFRERMLSVDLDCAHVCGQWEAESRKSGEALPAIDTLLAATAFSERLAIVTRNTKHFNKLNVRVEDPWT